MKRVKIILGLLVFTALIACNKDQSVVKKLEGKWLLQTIDGNAITEDQSEELNFQNCKLKDNDYCEVYGTYADGSKDTTMYRVQENGTQLVTKVTSTGTTFDLVWEITNLDKENLTIENKNVVLKATHVYKKK